MIISNTKIATIEQIKTSFLSKSEYIYFAVWHKYNGFSTFSNLQDAEGFFNEIRKNDTDFNLDKSNCKIEITDNENKCIYTIIVHKTHQF